MCRLAQTGKSVGLPWGGAEDYALARAVERARTGVAFLCIKPDPAPHTPGPGLSRAVDLPASGLAGQSESSSGANATRPRHRAGALPDQAARAIAASAAIPGGP